MALVSFYLRSMSLVIPNDTSACLNLDFGTVSSFQSDVLDDPLQHSDSQTPSGKLAGLQMEPTPSDSERLETLQDNNSQTPSVNSSC